MRSKSGLFLMELIIVIAFFALTSAVCIQLFATAHRLSTRSMGLQMSVINAQSAAEVFKMTGGNLAHMSDLLGADLQGSSLVMTYDDNWNPTSNETHIRFIMHVETNMEVVPATAVINVNDISLDEPLYELRVKGYFGRAE
jgi:Tfp pilus assembly protein PilE